MATNVVYNRKIARLATAWPNIVDQEKTQQTEDFFLFLHSLLYILLAFEQVEVT
jgi:hypothetical protein